MDNQAPDPYAPPRADLNESLAATGNSAPIFFVLSLPWIVVLPPLTVWSFAAYWGYRQWRAVKASGQQVNPVLRGIFLIFFIHSLFRRVQQTRSQSGLPRGRATSGLATVYVIINILSNGIGRIGGWFGLVGMLLLSFTASLILSTAQDDINELAHKVGNTANHHVGVGAHLIVVLGLAMFLYGAAAMVGALR
jgi:hypothetical protein